MSDRDLLDAVEARVLGAMIEKELTTPGQYPLSLSALTTACNQRSNRDPVTSFSESEVRAALGRLQLARLAGGVQSAGSRVGRYRHNAREAWGLSETGLAIVGELLLRGAQSPGDLRARASRMRPIPTQGDLAAELDALLARGYVARLEPLPGTRSHRFDQLLAQRERRPRSATERAAAEAPTEGGPATAARSPSVPGARGAPPAGAPGAPLPAEASGELPGGTPREDGPLDARVAALEGEVARLRTDLARLAGALGEDL